MATSHKKYELPNSMFTMSRFSQPLDRLHFVVKKLQTKIQKYWLFCSKTISFMEVPQLDDKKSKED